jgi:D-alanyl-D-alanine carboxypeptidase
MSGLSEKELISELRAKLELETAEDSFSGAVLIARNSAPIFAEAYGLADRERAIRNTVHTRFRLGSINKMFTGVATLQLAEAGKLRLDDLLGKYLSDFPQKGVATKVTVEHLLNHTSGTGDIFGPEFHARRTRFCQIAVSVTPERRARCCDRVQASCHIYARILRACRTAAVRPVAVIRQFMTC